MIKWEYRLMVYMGDMGSALEDLNKVGAEGWEAVCCQNGWWIIKRPVIDNVSRETYLKAMERHAATAIHDPDKKKGP